MKRYLLFLIFIFLIGCGGCHDDTSIPVDIKHEHTLIFILVHEGGLTEDGLTYAGITQHTWEAWRAKQTDKAHLPKEVKQLLGNNKDIVRRFYYDYFHDWHAWDIHPALQLIYADFVVLSGSQAVREVQKLAGVQPDGVWGYQTTLAVKEYNAKLKNEWKAFQQFDKMKRSFFYSLASRNPAKYKSSLSNWIKRSNDLEAYMEPLLK